MEVDIAVQKQSQILEERRENKPARILWIDTAKGFAIFFVMMGHTRIPLFLAWYIYSFHVPFFFFLSGYLFSIERNPVFFDFVKKRARLLILPYLAFSTISLIPYLIDAARFGQLGQLNLVDLVNGLLYLKGWILWNTPIWFLPCLFVIEMMYYKLRCWTYGRDPLLIFFLGLFACCGYIYSLWGVNRLPWGIDIAFLAIGFYGLGNLARNIQIRLPGSWKGYTLAISLVGASALLTWLQIAHTDLYKLQFDVPLLFYPAAIIGIAAWLTVATLLGGSRFWAYLGTNTLAILVSQFFVLWLLQLAAHYGFRYSPETTDGSGWLMTPLLLLSTLPIVALLNRYFPWLIGKSKPSGKSAPRGENPH